MATSDVTTEKTTDVAPYGVTDNSDSVPDQLVAPPVLAATLTDQQNQPVSAEIYNKTGTAAVKEKVADNKNPESDISTVQARTGGNSTDNETQEHKCEIPSTDGKDCDNNTSNKPMTSKGSASSSSERVVEKSEINDNLTSNKCGTRADDVNFNTQDTLSPTGRELAPQKEAHKEPNSSKENEQIVLESTLHPIKLKDKDKETREGEICVDTSSDNPVKDVKFVEEMETNVKCDKQASKDKDKNIEKLDEKSVSEEMPSVLTEDNTAKLEAADKDNNTSETEASKDDKHVHDYGKASRPKRGQRSNISDAKNQTQRKADVHNSTLPFVTKSKRTATKEATKTAEEDTLPTSADTDVPVTSVESITPDKQVSQETVCEVLNSSGVSMMDESVGTEDQSTPVKDDSRHNRGSGLYRAYKCKGCKYNTPIKTNLRRHASINIDYKPYLCNMCGNKFTDKSTLNFHNKKKHDGFENFAYSPEKDKDAALDQYIDMCIELEGKVKSPESALRNPAKYRDCTLGSFEMFKYFKSPLDKKTTVKRDKLSSGDNGGEQSSPESPSEKNVGKKSSRGKEQLFIAYPDGSTVQTANKTTEQSGASPVGPRRRGLGKKTLANQGLLATSSNGGSLSQMSPGNFVGSPVLPVSNSGMMHTQSSPQPAGINLIQTFSGITMQVQMPLPIPMQIPSSVPVPIAQAPAGPPSMRSQSTQSHITMPDTQTKTMESDEKKKKGRTKTIREILNLDNGARRQKSSPGGKHFDSKSRLGVGQKSSAVLLAGRGGRGRGRPRGKRVKNDQSSTDTSVQETAESEISVSGSEGDPSWPVSVGRKRGRPSMSFRQERIIQAVGVRRKYTRMKMITDHADGKATGTKRQKADEADGSRINVNTELNTLPEKKKPGRKRKVDAVKDPSGVGLDKQRKMACETGILTEETINNSLLALKRRQENITTATGTRVKRKYVRRVKKLTLPPKRRKGPINNSSTQLSTSNASSTMEEQRDINETGARVMSTVQSNIPRKRGRPFSLKTLNRNLKDEPLVGKSSRTKLNLVTLESSTTASNEEEGQKNMINSGGDKGIPKIVSPDTKKKRSSASPGRANCPCGASEHEADKESIGKSRNPPNSKNSTMLKSTRMTNYVKKYSQKYSKLAKAKSQGKILTKAAADSQIIKCPLCPYQSKSIHGVRLHAFWLHKMCKYSCADCAYSTVNRHEGIAHYKEEHPGKTANLVRSFCLEKEVEEDTTTPGTPGKVMTLSLDGSPTKQPSPSKLDVYNFSEETSSFPAKLTVAPDITSAVIHSQAPSFTLKGRCPECSYTSTIRGVGQHLMLAHNMINWVCKECGFRSQSKSKTVKHCRRSHKDIQPKIYKKAILVQADPLLNTVITSPKGTSTPKSFKGNVDSDNVSVPALSPTMPKLKKFPQPWKMKLGSLKGDDLKELIAKRKGKVRIPESIPVLPAEECLPSYNLHPRKLEALNIGFSCVYCFYAAPLRHQLHLHCYDKHTNHPACLMEFTKDKTVAGILADASVHACTTKKSKTFKSDLSKKDASSDLERVNKIISSNNDDSDLTTDAKDDKHSVKGMVSEKDENSIDLANKNQNENLVSDKETALRKSNTGDNIVAEGMTFGVLSVKPLKPHHVTLSHVSSAVSEGQSGSARTPAHPPGRPSTSTIGSYGANPLTPLVARLGAGQVRLHDTFQSSLDDLDSVLSSYGVRTLNMDMLTRKQFTEFIHRFGNSLQQM